MTGPTPAPTPHRRSRRRRRRSQDGPAVGGGPGLAATAAPAGKAPAAKAQKAEGHDARPTTPRFLLAPKAARADTDSAAEREARGGEGAGLERPEATPLGRFAARAAGTERTGGEPLDDATRAAAEADLGPLGPVRVHRGSRLAAAIGANAITYSGTIHLAPDAPDPHSAEGRRLMDHELTHVAQQARHGTEAAQFDITDREMDSGHGTFTFNGSELQTVRGGVTYTGFNTFIDFEPDVDSPYSTRIGLVQTININDLDTTAVQPPGVRSGTPEYHGIAGFDPARTAAQATTAAGDVDEGWRVDVTNVSRPERSEDEPWYLTSRGPGAHDRFGWNRGDGDIGIASLGDYPHWSADKDFDFEVAAVGRDNRTIYGFMRWGFSVIGGTVPDNTEYAEAVDVTTAANPTSPNYDAALERWRNYYTHEPVVIYFDTNEATPQPGQTGRLSDVPGWMASNGDAEIELYAYADRRGGSAYNARLARRRAAAVRQMLVDQGVPADRIRETLGAAEETTEHGSTAPGEVGSAGNLQSNRRVEIRFRRGPLPSGAGP